MCKTQSFRRRRHAHITGNPFSSRGQLTSSSVKCTLLLAGSDEATLPTSSLSLGLVWSDQNSTSVFIKAYSSGLVSLNAFRLSLKTSTEGALVALYPVCNMAGWWGETGKRGAKSRRKTGLTNISYKKARKGRGKLSARDSSAYIMQISRIPHLWDTSE